MWKLVDYIIDLDEAWDNLTQRQKDCLRLTALGFKQREIGSLLGISQATVSNHINAGKNKLPQYHLKP